MILLHGHTTSDVAHSTVIVLPPSLSVPAWCSRTTFFMIMLHSAGLYLLRANNSPASRWGKLRLYVIVSYCQLSLLVP